MICEISRAVPQTHGEVSCQESGGEADNEDGKSGRLGNATAEETRLRESGLPQAKSREKTSSFSQKSCKVGGAKRVGL